jgi:hypothetical protein
MREENSEEKKTEIQNDEKQKNEQKLPLEWDIDQVVSWLKNLNFEEEVIKNFKENEINGKVLMELNNIKLKDDLKIKQLGRRERLLEEIEKLKNNIKGKISKNIYNIIIKKKGKIKKK